MLRYQIIPVTHYQQNCTLLWCDETSYAAVVDPGGNIERILSVLVEHKLTLVKILLTHGHLDHVGGTAALIDAMQSTPDSPRIPVEGPHRDDMFWINMLPQQAQMMGFSTPQNFQPDIFFNDGDEVSVGNVRL
ncbi:MAG: MBL fold metallo-hydrolase, partial [Moraxellaceae bacterium]